MGVLLELCIIIHIFTSKYMSKNDQESGSMLDTPKTHYCKICGKLSPVEYCASSPCPMELLVLDILPEPKDCLCIKCVKARNPKPTILFSFADAGKFRYACEMCGNKRCPHHSDHRLECTGSNEPGQPGSIYI